MSALEASALVASISDEASALVASASEASIGLAIDPSMTGDQAVHEDDFDDDTIDATMADADVTSDLTSHPLEDDVIDDGAYAEDQQPVLLSARGGGRVVADR